MKVRIQVVIESEDGRVQDVEEVACLKRGTLTAEELGLNLAEAKEILHSVQQSLTTQQIREYTAACLPCPGCGRKRPQKGHHPIVFRTLFGKLTLDSVRLYQCDCQAVASQTFSPLAELLPERTAPELLYLEARWCSLLSFGVTLDLLQEVLPIGEDLNVTTLRNHLHQVAERMEAELGEERAQFVDSVADRPESSAIPPPKPPLAVGLDGAYVHAVSRSDRQEGWFEVIVGKSINSADEGRYVALVHNYDQKPKRRLYETLKAHGLEADQPVSFFSDGEDTLHQLQMYLTPQSEYILDWFHITMRLTGMSQMRKGMAGTEGAALVAAVEKDLESLKWHLWNGNIDPALRLVDGLKTMLAGEGISAAETAASGARVRQLYSGQPGFHPGLWRSLPQSRTDQHRVHGIGGQPAREPAHGQAATDALD